MAVALGRSVRLGSLTGQSEGSYSLPWTGAADIQFQIAITGGEAHTTERTYVRAGQQLEIWVREPVQESVLRR
jgi:hypothetical protein